MSAVEPILVSTLPDLVARLREARRQRGLLQRDVAEVLGVDDSAVSHWEIGLARPAAGLLIAWARTVGMPLWAIPEERADVATCRPCAGGMDASLALDLGSDTHMETEGNDHV